LLLPGTRCYVRYGEDTVRCSGLIATYGMEMGPPRAFGRPSGALTLITADSMAPRLANLPFLPFLPCWPGKVAKHGTIHHNVAPIRRRSPPDVSGPRSIAHHPDDMVIHLKLQSTAHPWVTPWLPRSLPHSLFCPFSSRPVADDKRVVWPARANRYVHYLSLSGSLLATVRDPDPTRKRGTCRGKKKLQQVRGRPVSGSLPSRQPVAAIGTLEWCV
jgi:hypothetical protein